MKIKNFENNKYNRNDISFLFFKFAHFPYEINNHFLSNKFVNFEIINYGNKSENNYSLNFKNDILKYN